MTSPIIETGAANSSHQLDQLDEQRDQLAREAAEILERDDYDADAQARVAAIENELEQIKERRDKIDHLLTVFRNPSAVESGDGATGQPARGLTRNAGPWDHTRGQDPITFRETVSDSREIAMRALEASRLDADSIEHTMRHVDGDVTDARMANYVRAVSDPEYKTAFLKVLRDPSHGATEWTREEQGAYQSVQHAQRAMSEGSGATGLYAVPLTLDPSFIITGAGSANPFREISRSVQTITNSWTGVTAGQISASWDAEATEVSDDSPTLTNPVIPVFTLRLFVPISIELHMDIRGVAEEVFSLFADAKANAEATAFVSGNGTSAPKGVITAVGAVTASRVSPTTGSAYVLADVYKLANALSPRFRPNATFAAENTVINLTRQFGVSGNYSDFTVDLTAPAPSHLLGKPLVESSAISSAITTSSDILIYGDFSRYVIADRAGMTVELVPHLFSTGNGRPTGQRGFFAFSRTGADVTDANAFRLLRL